MLWLYSCGLMVQDHITCMFLVEELYYAFVLKFVPYHIFICNWKVYSKVTGYLKGYSNVSLKMLPWWVTKKATLMGDWKGYPDGWGGTEKGTLMCHWKDNYVGCRITKKATMMCHWKDYGDEWRVTEKVTLTSDGSLKRLLWRVTEKTIVTSDGSLKRLRWWVMCHWKGYNDINWKGSSDIVNYVLLNYR
jgi:hypothetical protein